MRETGVSGAASALHRYLISAPVDSLRQGRSVTAEEEEEEGEEEEGEEESSAGVQEHK